MCEKKEIRPIKPATTYDEQIEKIKSRGCIIDNEQWAKEVLQQINYYRLTAYFLPYKGIDENYAQGTNFSNMYRTYEFDRKLRHLLYSSVEEIEIMLRAQLSYFHAHKYGPLGYKNPDNYNKKHNHAVFSKKVAEDLKQNKNKLAVKHHETHYGGEFPIWVIIELFTVSQLSFFYSDLLRADKKQIAKQVFGTTDTNLSSWLRCFTELRNHCAHYSRLYNVDLPSQPATPKNFGYQLKHKVFDYILVLKFLYYDPHKWIHEFVNPLCALLETYNDSIDLKLIGFPENWEEILTKANPTISK